MSYMNFINATAQGIAGLLYPHLEAVVHDARTGLIAHIANNFSKRKVGDPSLIEDIPQLEAGPDVIGPYENNGINGRVLRSITIAARDDHGEIIAFLCLNFDVSVINQVQQLLGSFAAGFNTQTRPEALFKADWREKLNEIVERISLETSVRKSEFGRREITLALAEARASGLLEIRNFMEYLTDYFEISRATVYNYLKAVPEPLIAAGTATIKAPAGSRKNMRKAAQDTRS
ncbi:helix-turn-helix transcriptional regulator [Pseudomonas gingeri]